GKVGAVTVTVRGLNGVTTSAPLHVQPVVRLVAIQGDNQTAAVGATLTVNLAVQAFDANNELVAGATIDFASADGHGTVSPASATTDEGGVATTKMTLGSAIGTYAFTATLAGAGSNAPATRVAATAIAGAAA